MPATTAKGAPYPVAADPNNVPADLEALARWVDARPGVTPMSTTARDALTGADLWNGRVIWNTTLAELQRYHSASATWIATPGGSFPSNPQTDIADIPFGVTVSVWASTDPGIPVAGETYVVTTTKWSTTRISQIAVRSFTPSASNEASNAIYFRQGVNDATAGTGATTEWSPWRRIMTQDGGTFTGDVTVPNLTATSVRTPVATDSLAPTATPSAWPLGHSYMAAQSGTASGQAWGTALGVTGSFLILTERFDNTYAVQRAVQVGSAANRVWTRMTTSANAWTAWEEDASLDGGATFTGTVGISGSGAIFPDVSPKVPGDLPDTYPLGLSYVGTTDAAWATDLGVSTTSPVFIVITQRGGASLAYAYQRIVDSRDGREWVRDGGSTNFWSTWRENVTAESSHAVHNLTGVAITDYNAKAATDYLLGITIEYGSGSVANGPADLASTFATVLKTTKSLNTRAYQELTTIHSNAVTPVEQWVRYIYSSGTTIVWGPWQRVHTAAFDRRAPVMNPFEIVLDAQRSAVVLGTAATLVMQTPTGGRRVVKQITVTNTTGSALTYSIGLDASGLTLGQNITIQPYSTHSYDTALVMLSAETFRGVASAATALVVNLAWVDVPASDADAHKIMGTGGITTAVVDSAAVASDTLVTSIWVGNRGSVAKSIEIGVVGTNSVAVVTVEVGEIKILTPHLRLAAGQQLRVTPVNGTTGTIGIQATGLTAA